MLFYDITDMLTKLSNPQSRHPETLMLQVLNTIIQEKEEKEEKIRRIPAYNV